MDSFADLVESVSIIPLETGKSTLLSLISSIVVADSHIYVRDRYLNGGVAIFTIDGKFIKRLSNGKDNTDLLLVQDKRTNRDNVFRIVKGTEKTSQKEAWTLGSVDMPAAWGGFKSFDGGYIINFFCDNHIYYYKSGKVYCRYVLGCQDIDDVFMSKRHDGQDYNKDMKDGKLYFTGKNLETKHVLFVEYLRHSKELGYLLYYKDSGRAIASGIKRDFFSMVQIRNSSSATDDCLIGYVPTEFFNLWDGSNPNNLISPDDMAKLKSVKEDDNPIIVLFKLKNEI